MSGRFILIGVANSRNPWFSDVARWTTSGVIAAEYTQAMSIDEVRAILGSGRKVSAVLAASMTHGLDREFIAMATSLGVSVIVVADPLDNHDWDSLGVASTLSTGFSPDELRETLDRHARMIDPTERRASSISVATSSNQDLAPLVAVLGAGGAGSSTLAMALATGMGSSTGDRTLRRATSSSEDSTTEVSTALADLTRSADLAMYHDVGDVIPGLPELVELHRGDTPDPQLVRELLFPIPGRPYELLLGQRRSRDSAAMAPLSTAAAIDGLRRTYDRVVVDVDPTFEGEAETGSVDIELFNTAQRHALTVASVVIVVSTPGMRGVRRLATLIASIGRFGVPARRIVPVWNHAPRSPSTRASLTKLTAETNPLDEPVHPPLFTRRVRLLEDIHHAVDTMPSALVDPLTNTVQAVLAEHGNRDQGVTKALDTRRSADHHVRVA